MRVIAGGDHLFFHVGLMTQLFKPQLILAFPFGSCEVELRTLFVI